MFDAFLKFLQDPTPFIQSGGLILVVLIVFAETGLFFCFFLPGDYLLFTAGVLCSGGIIQEPIWMVVLAIITAAIAGNYVGYYFGRYVGKGIYNRKDSWFFKRKHVESTEVFFQTHGGKALIMARFLPIIRTFTPIVAGIIKMEMGKFSWFVAVGAIIWGSSITLLGFFLGKLFPGIVHYLHYIIVGFVTVTSIVAYISYRKMNKA